MAELSPTQQVITRASALVRGASLPPGQAGAQPITEKDYGDLRGLIDKASRSDTRAYDREWMRLNAGGPNVDSRVRTLINMVETNRPLDEFLSHTGLRGK